MNIEGSVALVTGANRGLGAAFCRALLDRGATKVYAGRATCESSILTAWSPLNWMSRLLRILQRRLICAVT